MRNAYKFVVGNPEGKRPFGRPRCRWEDNNESILKKYFFSWLVPVMGSYEHGCEVV
jgi:hypothetical protein